MSQLAEEVVNVIALVSSQCHATMAGDVLDQQQSGIAFGRTVDLRGAWTRRVRCGFR